MIVDVVKTGHGPVQQQKLTVTVILLPNEDTLQYEQEHKRLVLSRGDACICCLTCCLHEAAIAEPLLCTAGLAKGHLCSWRVLHSPTGCSSLCHRSKLMYTCTSIKYTIWLRSVQEKQTLALTVHHRTSKTAFIPLEMILVPKKMGKKDKTDYRRKKFQQNIFRKYLIPYLWAKKMIAKTRRMAKKIMKNFIKPPVL